jgi:Spy/CpxP family protein refolding chaperone
MRILLVTASLVTAAALAVPAAAQSFDDARQPVPAQAGPKRGQKVQKGQAIVRALRDIGVDDARIQQVVAIRERYSTQHQRARANSKQYREALKGLVAKDSHDEAAYQRALDGLEKARAEHRRLRDAESKEVRQLLKPSEQAKLLARKHRDGPGAGRHANGAQGDARRRLPQNRASAGRPGHRGGPERG